MTAANDSIPIVTIDGPSSSGKGTISRIVAARVGWNLLDSGALYRLVATGGLLRNLDPDDVEAHVGIARLMQVKFGSMGVEEQVFLDGQDVTKRIRTEEAGAGASRVAAWPAVRAALMDRQRSFASAPGLVADGRDMGTVVFPEAPLKVFLTASAEERARRRYKQLKEKGLNVTLSSLFREIEARDERDANRK